MHRYIVSYVVLMALTVGCEGAETSADDADSAARADSHNPKEPESGNGHGPARDAYGRPLIGADGPMRYHAPGVGELGRTVEGLSAATNQFTLGAYTNYPVGSWNEAVAIGDVTCDGRPDVVTTTTYDFDAARDYRVFVFRQLADGSLDAPVSYPYGATANRNGLVLADLNKDGCLDVVVGHGKGISVLLANKTTGGLKPAVVVSNGDADTLSAMDVNRDDNIDIISLGWSRGASIFYGNGTGGFSQIAALATNAVGYNDHEVGDLNSDGIPDLAVMSGQAYAVPNLSVHLHNGTHALITSPKKNRFINPHQCGRGRPPLLSRPQRR